MGLMSRKLFPSCEIVCVCCPALRPSSRRPVKRYKKLLADIFPKSVDGPVNERKIIKLCEYAAKNPIRIPKIAKFLEQRNGKEMHYEHVNFVRIVTETYSKLLNICKEQMAYFAISLLNVLEELLDCKHREMQILGCQTLTKFVYSQTDNTYARNIETLIHKVCLISRECGEECIRLRAASLQCLSAIIWFMTGHSYIFADFDEIIHSILEMYQFNQNISQRNWVDEISRCDGRAIFIGGTDINLNSSVIPQASEGSSSLCREDHESPEIWSRICIQNLAFLAKESAMLHCVLEPLFLYFDSRKQWAPRCGIALLVFCDMLCHEKRKGNEQLILPAIVRHLDHKNIGHDVQMKSEIIQTVTFLARQSRLREIIADSGVVRDLYRHLRKSLEVTAESVGPDEFNLSESFQNFTEDCLLEIIKGVNDLRPLYDMMALVLEKLSSVAAVAKSTIGSLLILSHIISVTSNPSKMNMLFPDSLLMQLLRAINHSDNDTRFGAHQLFAVILVHNSNHSKGEAEYLYETKKWQSRTTSAFASATALLEKLRREKEILHPDKTGNSVKDDQKERELSEDNCRTSWARRYLLYSKLIFPSIDKIAAFTLPDMESNVMLLSEDQVTQLLSAFWTQAIREDNLPLDYEAISHSYTLTLLSASIKNSSHLIRFFQLALSLLNFALAPNGCLSYSRCRCLFMLAISMLVYPGNVHQFDELTSLLKHFTSSKIDPYLKIGEDLRLHVRPQVDLTNFGSHIDEEAAASTLSGLRNAEEISDWQIIDVVAPALSNICNASKDVLVRQLKETFVPEEVAFFGSNPSHDWSKLQTLSEESLSLDEECSRISSVDETEVLESPVTNVGSSISRKLPPSCTQVLGVGHLLESALYAAGQVAGSALSTSPLPYDTMTSQCEALGAGTRRKLSTWLLQNDSNNNTAADFPSLAQLGISKVKSDSFASNSATHSEHWVSLSLPPASPFDNFLKAARL